MKRKKLNVDPYNLFKNIKRARVLAGLTQKELAKKVGVSNKTISAYEKGRALPPLLVLIKIAEATDVKLESLISRKDKVLSLEKDKKIKEIEERINNLEQLIVKILKKEKI